MFGLREGSRKNRWTSAPVKVLPQAFFCVNLIAMIEHSHGAVVTTLDDDTNELPVIGSFADRKDFSVRVGSQF